MPPSAQGAGLERRIGLFDATTAVVGGIVGAGIFMNPAAVARIVSTPNS
jgi:amino acid transporter